MPHLFRTRDGTEWKPSRPIPLTLADGTEAEGIWAGSAQVEKLKWWLSQPGHDLAQTTEISAIAIRGEKSGKVRWGEAPAGARLFFVLGAPTASKANQIYRLAKMVTTASTPEQEEFFGDERFALFGTFSSDGTIATIPPVLAPLMPPDTLEPGELFYDPVTAAYDHGVDRSLLRENLRLTPAQRLEKMTAALQMVEGLRQAKIRNR